MAKKVDLSQFAKTMGADNAARMADLKKATMRALAKTIPVLVANSPVDTGVFAQSWYFTATEHGAILGNSAPHAAIIEYGARKHMAPIGPLLAWAKRVLQDPSQPPKYSSHVWALAKYTQKKIAEQDTPPHNILENEIPNIIDRIKDEYVNHRDDS